jgi:phosphoglucomutase
VLEEVKRVAKIHRLPLDDAKAKGLVEVLDQRIDHAYLTMVRRDMALCDERDATLVFTPLHGTGLTIVPPALAALDFRDVHLPMAQTTLDGHFPTVPKNYPNPEVPAALGVAVELGKTVKADLVMGSDPDADRLGFFVPKTAGDFVYMTGNQFQTLMLEFMLARLREAGRLPQDAYALTTLVTTKALREIARSYGVEIVDHLLVGFKNLAAEIRRREGLGQSHRSMVFACEESIGYMLTAELRDKDSGTAAVVAGQMAAYYKKRGLTLWQRLDQLWQRYGYFADDQFSVFLEGEAGADRMRQLMTRLRRDPPREIAGMTVRSVIDRQEDCEWTLATGAKAPLGYERSNVLVFNLAGGPYTSVTVRPSGTEPKIKHYIAHHGPDEDRAAVDQQAAALQADVKRIEREILAAL